VLLPIAPYSETSGTFVSTDGTVQSFNGVVQPLGETRPAWKVLRVLGNLLGLAGFDYDSSEEVRRAAFGGDADVAAKLANGLAPGTSAAGPAARSGELERIGEVPSYAADAIVRRARSLQATPDAALPAAAMNRALAERLGLREGDLARVRQGGAEAIVPFAIDDKLPAGCVRLPGARPETAALGALFGGITIERVPAQQKAAV
jgi:NADH-quinone oxidoreductase subunit G